jgi:hypothetical protein
VSESPEREREIAAGAIGEMLRRHKQQGHNMTIITEAMIAIGRRGLGGLVSEPTGEDYRAYTADAFNASPESFDKSELAASFAIHGALTAAARDGAGPVLALLRRIAEEIQQGVADRQLRSGDATHDLN